MGYKAGRDMGVLSYTKADRELSNRSEKKIGNNTYLIRRGEDIAVRHWSTDIITYHPDGSISLVPHNSCTTKARYNAYLDNRVWSEDGWLFINDLNGIVYEFEEDLKINPDGSIDGAPYFAKRLGEFTGKEILTWETVAQTVAAFSLEDMSKVWKKFRKDRTVLAQFCTQTFLPLIIGQSEGHEDWHRIATERLRA